TVAMAAALLAGGAGLALALAGGGTAPVWVVLALTGMAAGVYAAGRLAWRGTRPALEAHVGLGIARSRAAALASFTLGAAARTGAPDALLAAVAVLAFAGLLAAEGRLRPMTSLLHAAVVAASLAGYFVARFAGLTDPQWYVAAPGLALLGVGLG